MPIPESNVIGIIVINVHPVIHLGPLAIHWYGVMYAVAFLVAYRFAVVPLAQRAGVARDIVSKITVWTIVIGLVGGRLYYVLQQPDLVSHYLPNPIHIIAFWEGGMAFFGAIIAGFITLTICAWRYGLNPWLALDGSAAFAVVGQPIGRIGNLINGDILGSASTRPWATAYANPGAVAKRVSTLHAGALYRRPTRRGVRGAGHDRHRANRPCCSGCAKSSGLDWHAASSASPACSFSGG